MKTLKIFIIAINIIGITVQYGLTVVQSDHGPKINELDKNLRDLSSENDYLHSQILSKTSLNVIEEQALLLQMTKASTLTLKPLPVADNSGYEITH